MLRIEEVETKEQLIDFIKFPEIVYKENKVWVEPIIKSQLNFFSNENPFWKHALKKLIIVKDNDKIVGRIAGIINKKYIDYSKEKVAYFGFFECIENLKAAVILFKEIGAWAKNHRMEILRGPLNGTISLEFGFLLKGFNLTPKSLMPYSPKYYLKFMKKLGFKKAHDLYAYDIDLTKAIPLKLKEAERIGNKQLKIRHIIRGKFKKEAETINKIINKAMIYTHHWQFAPQTNKDFIFLVKDLKTLMVPDLIFVAEYNHKPAGVVISYPNFNEALKEYHGHLNIFQEFSFWVKSKGIKHAKLDIIAVAPEFEHKGIGKLMMYDLLTELKQKGYRRLEYSWVLDNNKISNHLAKEIGGKIYKKYRLFESNLPLKISPPMFDIISPAEVFAALLIAIIFSLGLYYSPTLGSTSIVGATIAKTNNLSNPQLLQLGLMVLLIGMLVLIFIFVKNKILFSK